MDQAFINKSGPVQQVMELKKEIEQLESSMKEIQRKISAIQEKCDHSFMEMLNMRKCIKCDWAESAYY
jgi:peptidoglycan hydrolase CwlO-like protein